ncbi:F-box protein CPR1-like [Humulus lupulus]|uniref:F-box protein CPR1-like n=1 Tax=Humulus lupulus TaxID=3486 RepID=UPI002B40112B|nr:F-box protein CPR1-like [Humulus lupulus]
MTRLPEDAIASILCRLPVKDLLRYRCVSKSWRFLVDSSHFIKMHLNHSMETHSNSTLILGDQRLLHWVDLDTLYSPVRLETPIYDGGKIEILGCCNGLLALEFSNGGTVIWNPTTRKYRKVPISGLVDLPFPDNLYEYGIVGFGYDPVNDDHKLVRMVHYFEKDIRSVHSFHSEVKFYSLNFNTWKRVCDFPYQGYKQGGNGVFASNALHWMVTRELELDALYLIVAFDLVTEEFRELPLPDEDGGEDEKFFVKLVELGGFLCATCLYFPHDNANHVDIYIMKEYGVDSWTKLFSVMPSNVTGYFEYVMPLKYSKSGHQVLLHQDGETYLLYDIDMNRTKNVGKISGVPRSFDTCVCARSLVGLGVGDEDNPGKKVAVIKNKKKEEKQQLSRKKRDDFLSKGFKLVL